MASSDNLHSQQFQLFDPGPVDAGYKPSKDIPVKKGAPAKTQMRKLKLIKRDGSRAVSPGYFPRTMRASPSSGWRDTGVAHDETQFPGMRNPQASPDIPAHGKISRSSERVDTPRKKTAVQKDPKEYTTYYHSSNSATPPHLAQHPHNDAYTAFPEEHGRSGSNDVLFAGTYGAAGAFSRQYMHQYRVPKKAESATVMADDDLEHLVKTINDRGHPAEAQDQFKSALYSKRKSPTLFESISAKRTEVAGRNEAQRMRNNVEDRGNISVIMPKSKMEGLGIQYGGMQEYGDMSAAWKMPESFPERKKQSKTPAKTTSTGKPAGKMVWNSDKKSPHFPSTHKTMNNAPETIKQSKKYPPNFPLAQHKKTKKTKVAKPKDAHFDLTGAS